MNIKDAKQEIIRALKAYHKKDSLGIYRYPSIRQRPILLMGPPGIGKTAIMEQIEAECRVGLVSYTMTHHTRQSAIGLPRITQREYRGQSYSVTEYTLSEIITSVYECMERTGFSEGILFLDEINCVSETLAPVMLQFLQNKQFGNHRIPDGWLIVAAGNPAAYNKSVREFDIVTLDRVRKIEVEAELDCWMDYAVNAGVHGAILSYLRLKSDRFYSIRQEQDKKHFVTARGWEDLSALLESYEEDEVPVDEAMTAQFLQDPSTAADFAAFYQLYRAYGRDFRIPELLRGEAENEEIDNLVRQINAGSLEIRFALVGQMTGFLGSFFREYTSEEKYLQDLMAETDRMSAKGNQSIDLTGFIDHREEKLQREERNGLITKEKERNAQRILHTLRMINVQYLAGSSENLQDIVSEHIEGLEKRQTEREKQIDVMLDRAFAVLERIENSNGEIFLFVSTLARMKDAAAFLSSHPNEAFLKNSGSLLV